MEMTSTPRAANFVARMFASCSKAKLRYEALGSTQKYKYGSATSVMQFMSHPEVTNVSGP